MIMMLLPMSNLAAAGWFVMVLSDPLLVEGEPGGAYIPEIHNLKDRKIKYAQQQTCKYIQRKLILERNHVYLKTFKQTVCWVAGREN